MIHFESPLIQIAIESLFAVLLEKYRKENDLSVYQVASGLSPMLYAARSQDGAQFGVEWKKSLLFSG